MVAGVGCEQRVVEDIDCHCERWDVCPRTIEYREEYYVLQSRAFGLQRIAANALSAAAIVAAMSSAECAADTKPTSKTDGAR